MASDIILVSGTALAGIGMITLATLHGWQGWLTLRLREIEARRHEPEAGSNSGKTRIELADLKERIRKLEAIAAGVDL